MSSCSTSATIRVPRNQEVLVDPQGLPGVYMARIVATLENKMRSSDADGLPPLVVGKSPLEPFEIVSSPRSKYVARSDDSALVTIRCDRKAGSGKCLPELPLVPGMTYRRKVVLFPLRTESIIKLTQLIKMRLRIKKGK